MYGCWAALTHKTQIHPKHKRRHKAHWMAAHSIAASQSFCTHGQRRIGSSSLCKGSRPATSFRMWRARGTSAEWSVRMTLCTCKVQAFSHQWHACITVPDYEREPGTCTVAACTGTSLPWRQAADLVWLPDQHGRGSQRLPALQGPGAART